MRMGYIWLKVRQQFARGFLASWNDLYVVDKIRFQNVNPGLGVFDTPLALLTSKHDWRLALWMLASLEKFIGQSIQVVLFEDGSLTDEQVSIFSHRHRGAIVYRRHQLNTKMEVRLKGYRRCLDYRLRMPHALKSFDIPEMIGSDRYFMIDPDVLFFRRPTELIKWASDSNDTSCWFNRDVAEASVVDPGVVKDLGGFDLWPSVNSGLCLLNRSTVNDFAMYEDWLSFPGMQDGDKQWRVEQTLLAMAASRANKGGLLPPSYEVSLERKMSAGCVARHYVGAVRQRFYGEGIQNLKRELLR